MAVNISIPSLGNKFQDYRQDIPGDSFNWGPVIKASDIDTFTFHHSVTKQTAKSDGNWKKECDTLANLHLARGWAGIGYRFAICSDGTVAYVGDLGRGGSAVGDHNNHMFSACFVGDFTKELPTAAQVHSAHLLAKHFLTQMPQYPNLSKWDQIKGHKDFNLTACPGSNWTGPDNLRDRIINDRFTGYPDPQPQGVTPAPEPTPPGDNCEQKLSKANARIGELEEQERSKQATIDNLNQQINDRNNDIVQLNAKISTLETQVTQLTQAANNASEQANLVPGLKQELEAQTEKVHKYQEAEKSWNRAKGQYEKQIEDLKKNSFQNFVGSILEKLFGKK